MSYSYDILNRPIKTTYNFGGENFETTQSYGDDSRKGVNKLVNGINLTTEYDNLSREKSQEIGIGTSKSIKTNKTYVSGTAAGGGTNKTTTLVSGYDTGIDSWENGSYYTSALKYEYEYDDNGNISKRTTIKSGAPIEVKRYIYDGLNQLKKEINDTTKEEITYTYDIDGNITKVAKDPNPEDPDSAITVTSYTYGNDAWKDQLTKYGSHTITYDEIGNPLSYRNSMSFTWKNGREMATANINGKNCSYYYNTDGIRTRKIAGTETTDYFVDDSGRIIGQESSTGRKILFMYDGSGAVVGMRYKSNASAQYVDYYYVKNAQGDITGIVDKDDVLKYTYEYDSWGKLLNIKTQTGSVLNPAVINYATQNPFRYRGYYYDNETGFYYLNSRYYDPTVKRFINADGLVSTGQDITGYNMFSYCCNNPISRADSTGLFWKEIEGFFKNAGNAIAEGAKRVINALGGSFQAEIGIGVGIGTSLNIGPVKIAASAYQDGYTIGLNNGNRYTGVKGSAGASVKLIKNINFGLSTEYIHKFEINEKRIIDNHDAFSMPWDIYNCSNTDVGYINGISKGGTNVDSSSFIGFSAEAHVLFGGHATIGWDTDEFWRILNE